MCCMWPVEVGGRYECGSTQNYLRHYEIVMVSFFFIHEICIRRSIPEI